MVYRRKDIPASSWECPGTGTLKPTYPTPRFPVTWRMCLVTPWRLNFREGVFAWSQGCLKSGAQGPAWGWWGAELHPGRVQGSEASSFPFSSEFSRKDLLTSWRDSKSLCYLFSSLVFWTQMLTKKGFILSHFFHGRNHGNIWREEMLPGDLNFQWSIQEWSHHSSSET